MFSHLERFYWCMKIQNLTELFLEDFSSFINIVLGCNKLIYSTIKKICQKTSNAKVLVASFPNCLWSRYWSFCKFCNNDCQMVTISSRLYKGFGHLLWYIGSTVIYAASGYSTSTDFNSGNFLNLLEARCFKQEFLKHFCKFFFLV